MAAVRGRYLLGRFAVAVAVVGWVLAGSALVGSTPRALAQSSPSTSTTYTVTDAQLNETRDGCSGIRPGDSIQWQPSSPLTSGTLTVHRTAASPTDQSWSLFPARNVDSGAPDDWWVTQNVLGYQPPRQDFTRFEHALILNSGLNAALQLVDASGNTCVFQVAAAASAPQAPPPTTASPPLELALACDTGSLQDAGQVTCTAAVANQADNAQITYQWTVDGQVQAGVTGNVLYLDGIPAGDHQVSVTAADVANNLTVGPRAASFTRTAVVPGGPLVTPPPTAETTPPPSSSAEAPSSSAETAPPPTLGAGGTTTPPAIPSWSACHLGMGIGASAQPAECPVPMAAVVSGGGAALAAALGVLAALLMRRQRLRRPPSPAPKESPKVGDCGERLRALDMQIDRTLNEMRPAIDERNAVVQDKLTFDAPAAQLRGSATHLRSEIMHDVRNEGLIELGSEVLGKIAKSIALIAAIHFVPVSHLIKNISEGGHLLNDVHEMKELYDKSKEIGENPTLVQSLNLRAAELAKSIADTVEDIGKQFDNDLAQRAADIDTLANRVIDLFNQREATYQHCLGSGDLPTGTWHRPRPEFPRHDGGAIYGVIEE